MLRKIIDWLWGPVDRLDDELHAAGPDRWVGDGGELHPCGARRDPCVCVLDDLHVGPVVSPHSGDHRCGSCGRTFARTEGGGEPWR